MRRLPRCVARRAPHAAMGAIWVMSDRPGTANSPARFIRNALGRRGEDGSAYLATARSSMSVVRPMSFTPSAVATFQVDDTTLSLRDAHARKRRPAPQHRSMPARSTQGVVDNSHAHLMVWVVATLSSGPRWTVGDQQPGLLRAAGSRSGLFARRLYPPTRTDGPQGALRVYHSIPDVMTR